MSQDRVLSMIGLAAKAGRAVSGEFQVDTAGKSGQAKLVILAEDASDRTKKSTTDMCVFYKVPYMFYGTKESLGHALGKDNRAAAAILDDGFADAIRKKADESNSKQSEEGR